MALFGLSKMQLPEAGDLLTELILACAVTLTPNKPLEDFERQLLTVLEEGSVENKSFAFSFKVKKTRKVFAEVNRSFAIKVAHAVKNEKWSEARQDLSAALLSRVKLLMIPFLEDAVAAVAFEEARDLVFEKIPLITQDLDSLFNDPDKQAQIRQIESKVIAKWRAMGLVYKS